MIRPTAGQALRFLQEYFLVCCSLADIVARFRRQRQTGHLPDKVAIQLNDTHPAMAVAELMRILLDQAKLGWDEAWDLTVRTLAYTNHTLLPEALEKWPVRSVRAGPARDSSRSSTRSTAASSTTSTPCTPEMRIAGKAHEPDRGRDPSKVRMAHLAIVGTHSTNGVAAIHSELLRPASLRDFADMFPERFNNKTNGVTPRRWLLLANPALSQLITEAIGDDWMTDLHSSEH